MMEEVTGYQSRIAKICSALAMTADINPLQSKEIVAAESGELLSLHYSCRR